MKKTWTYSAMFDSPTKGTLNATDGTDRYHVWVHPTTLEPADGFLYKNPCVEPRQPGHYWSRKLKLTSAPSRRLFEAMKAANQSYGLMDAALAIFALTKRREQLDEEDRQRAETMKEAAFEMLVALRNMVYEQKRGTFITYADRLFADAQAAIDKAERRS